MTLMTHITRQTVYLAPKLFIFRIVRKSSASSLCSITIFLNLLRKASYPKAIVQMVGSSQFIGKPVSILIF